MADIKPGVETTEYKELQNAKIWSTVISILGMVVTFGSTAATALGADTKWGIVIGAAVTIASEVRRCLNQLGYTKSRTDVKVTANVKPAK